MLKFYKFRHFQKIPELAHGVTQKSSMFPHEFSLALHTNENTTDILNNRLTLSKYLKTSNHTNYIVANQIHGDNITLITSEHTRGWHEESTAVYNCDALVTDLPHTMLCILTADCVPIFIYDPKKQVIAAIHAGWKGTKEQIVSKTVQKMIDVYDCNATDIIAGIAPSIGKCCYEVGEDVAKYFYDLPNSYTKKENDKYMLDLPYINEQQLLNCGLLKENIEMSQICTACQVDRFFSYRKEQGCSGRFMSMIGLKDMDENTSLL